MGDADHTQDVMSVAEVESLMENAWTELDEGLDGLFNVVNLLNEQNASVMSEMASWQRLRKCFMALNIFVVPIMLSIWIAFGSTDLVAVGSTTEVVLQTIVMVLMLVSGTIGFPLYVLALMRDFFAEDEAPRISEVAENRRSLPATEGSEATFSFGGDSLETVSEMARQANRRIFDNFRQDLERRGNRIGEVDQSRSRFESSENDADNRVAVAESQQVDLNPTVHKEETDFCGFKVIIMNKTQDLSVEIEKQEDTLSFQDDESQLLDLRDECLPNNIRNIAVENVGEGDSNRVCPKDLAGRDCWQGQVFGL